MTLGSCCFAKEAKLPIPVMAEFSWSRHRSPSAKSKPGALPFDAVAPSAVAPSVAARVPSAAPAACAAASCSRCRVSRRRQSVHASSAPTAALCFTSAILAASDAPCVRSATRFNTKGVTSRPPTPPADASSNARSIAACTAAASACACSGMGTPNRIPPRPVSSCAATTAAASSVEPTESGEVQPDSRVKKAGNSRAPMVSTGTPCVSSTSSVRAMSRILLIPAHTTATGVLDSSTKSADTSIEFSPPRWTPPTPPVTKTEMRAARAMSMVAETVVAPTLRLAIAAAMSRREHLSASRPHLASSSSWLSSSPTTHCPSMSAMVAGVAPHSRTMRSTSRAVCDTRTRGTCSAETGGIPETCGGMAGRHGRRSEWLLLLHSFKGECPLLLQTEAKLSALASGTHQMHSASLHRLPRGCNERHEMEADAGHKRPSEVREGSQKGTAAAVGGGMQLYRAIEEHRIPRTMRLCCTCKF
eukprot:2861726-Pleurochrysis_carterae.AAC.7